MAGSKIQAFWNHPAGPKTIHFWAPTFKWVISIANVADFSKPPEQLSYPHQSVVAISGLIWSRYSTQIIPTKQVMSNVALVKVFLEEMHGIRQCPYGHMEKEKYLKNWNLVSVNLTMAATGFYQLSRKIQHDYYPEAEPAEAKE